MSAMRDMSPIIDPPQGSSFINRYGVSKYLSVVLSSDEVASSNIIKDGFLAEDNKRISLQRDRWQITAYSRKRGVQLIFPVTAFQKNCLKKIFFLDLVLNVWNCFGKLRDLGFQRFNKGQVRLPKRMNFRKTSMGGGVVIFNPKSHVEDFGP